MAHRRHARSLRASRTAAVEPLERRALMAGNGPLVISEFMADNSTGLLDQDFEPSDWIEIHNPTASAINVNGYYLTDDAALPTKWRMPSAVIPANGYLVVFASDKDRAGPQLHTNFKLSDEGEYLGLVRPDGVTVSDEYAPEFPEQVENVSYGVFNGAERYFTTPTPGAANAAGSTGVVSDTVFSVDRGFYDTAFQLRIATLTPGATIRFTTDGSLPTPTRGAVYANPLLISKTTAVRAIAYKPGLVPSDVDTQTYVFVEDVVRQTHAATISAGFPSTWGTITPDYGMDSNVIGQTGPDQFGGIYAATIRNDLKAVPTMSIVLPVADMFGPNGIYSNSTLRGDQWERATSVELIDPANGPGDTEFQVNAGIQIQGGAFRGDGLTKKHSFRLLFKDRWGVSKLDFPIFGPDSTDGFDSITLRADANDGWQWSGAGGKALYARDTWSRFTQRDMGQPSSDGTRVHLYINGIYWGLYNPVERPDAAFAASYIGGDKDDWDVYNQDGVTDGTNESWDTMVALANDVANAPDEASRSAAYQRIQGNNPDGTDNPDYQDYLDVDSLIDYMLLNIFTGNADWPHRNWYAGRLRADTGIGTDETGFKFFSWDAESALDLWADVNSNRTNVNVGAATPYALLRSSADFRDRFADRVQLHMFGNGALSTANNKARMAAITAQVDRAIVAESARWGDQHREPPYTRADWAAERDNLLRQGGYFDQRWGIVLGQLRAAGLYGAVDGPAPSLPGGQAAAGTQIFLQNASGTIYYSLDGSDPRLPDGSPNPAATVISTTGGMVVPSRSVWKFLDDGSDQGTGWKESTFDDSSWAEGQGQLGYGDGDETTVVTYGPDPGNKYITTYFRKTFEVEDPGQLPALRLRVLRDDGAIVYVNGRELGRGNLPGGAVSYVTPALGAGEDVQDEFVVDPSWLRPGPNVVAVEIHQSGGGSSDISFDLELFAPAPAVPITLPGGTTRLRARARDASGNWSALSDTVYHAEPSASASNVAVTEVQYNPAPPEPALGETSVDRGDYEFIELTNTSGERVALYGARFSLGIKFDFPVDAYLDPGERAVVVKNVTAFRSRYGNAPRVLGTFTGNLGNDGQMTILQDARGRLIDSFRYGDTSDWPGRADGNGASLEVIDTAGDYNDADNWRSSREFGGTPGAPGTGPLPGVVVNEVLANTDAPQVDRVELFNPTAAAVDLGGWYLSDSAANYRKFRIPDGTVLQPGAHLVFDESALGFSLDGEGDDVWLVEADGATGRLTRFVDRVEFGATAPGESLGRYPSGSPGAGLYPMAPTLGAPNVSPRTGPVVINEIHYAPAAGGQEFVELFNPTASDVSLAGWRFTDGIDYTFTEEAVVPAGGYLLLVGGDPNAFINANNVPGAVVVVGGFSFEGFLNVLDNAGERLTLSRPGAVTPGQDVPMLEADRVRYDIAAPWPVAAGGGSVARRWTNAWSDAAVNWGAESAGGSPGRVNFGGAVPAPFVAGRHVFHNNSGADGRSAAAGHADDGAVSARAALLPGQRASLSNVSSYARGVNGIMVDIANLPAGSVLTAADFEVRSGNGTTWAAGPAPTAVGVRRGGGVGGSDRVTLTFPDNSVLNTWLRLTVRPSARTGLAAADVFYFGSLPGETGDGAGRLSVGAVDVARTRQNLFTRNAAAIARYDFNADGAVSAADLLVARNNQRRSLAVFDAPAGAGAIAPAGRADEFGAPGRLAPTRRTALAPGTQDLLA